MALSRGPLTAEGKPLPGVRIVFQSLGDVRKTVKTDSAGAFIVDNLPDGRYVASLVSSVWMLNEDSNLRPIAVTNHGETSVDLKAIRGGVIKGLVIDATRRPVAGEVVTILAESAREGDLTLSADAITDDEGRFRISGLSHRLYKLSVGRMSSPHSPSPFRRIDYPQNIEIGPGQERDVGILILNAAAESRVVSGRFLGTGVVVGTPIGFQFFGETEKGEAVRYKLSSDSDGYFTVGPVQPGRYTIAPVMQDTANSVTFEPHEIAVRGENLFDLVIPVSQSVSITGRILIGNRPVLSTDCYVVIKEGSDVGGKQPFSVISPGPNGSFRANGLRRQVYTVAVMPRNINFRIETVTDGGAIIYHGNNHPLSLFFTIDLKTTSPGNLVISLAPH